MKFKNSEIFFNPMLPKSGIFQLNKEESNHCIKVMRLNVNDQISVVDGKGKIAECKILKANPKATELEIIHFKHSLNQLSQYIHIAISPTKNINRFEWFLEKSVELGIGEITPIITDNSERNRLNYCRLEKKLITALKQSQNLILPKLNPMLKIKEFINIDFENSQKFICHNGDSKNRLLKNEFKKNKKYIILIGPEGGFSNNEVKNAEEKSFIQVLLGNSRYRTETAGILACHTIHLFSS